MKLTHASRYALHAMAHLAALKENPLLTSHDLAKARGLPERFLLKVLRPLVAARLLHSAKGPHGGYRLARPASQITMLEVIEAVDGPIRGRAPRVEATAATGLNRPLTEICDQAADIVCKQLREVYLADLVGSGKA
jgi:Rrf2 family protein